MEKRFSVKLSVLQSMLNYLKSRPYDEVFLLIKELQTDAQPIVVSSISQMTEKGDEKDESAAG